VDLGRETDRTQRKDQVVESFTFSSESEADTDRLAAALAGALTPGTVVCLNGPLGAGKTRLVQGVARALGCTSEFVNSPTFTLVQEYAGRLPIVHIDAYRLRDSDEFLELGGDELLAGDGAAFIEWADRIADVLPEDVLRVTLSVTGPCERSIQVEGAGPRSRTLVSAVAARLA
jgi:tRNA threonylcarbamoyladenosine biosynthesis protein TsaE